MLGAPEGVAQLDPSAKIRLDQLQMAQETIDKFEEVDAALETIAPAEGDGIRLVGNVVNLDITNLTLAP